MNDFRTWLFSNTKLNKKSTSDVISRLKRASQFIDIFKTKDGDELLFKLGKKPKFNELGISVKSQLRRAVRLYKQYEKNKSG